MWCCIVASRDPGLFLEELLFEHHIISDDLNAGGDGDDEELVGYAGQQPGRVVVGVLRSSRQLITMMEALPADWEAGAPN